jgi:hypothetical protein
MRARFTSLTRFVALTTGLLSGLAGCQDSADSPTDPLEHETATPVVGAAAAPLVSFGPSAPARATPAA